MLSHTVFWLCVYSAGPVAGYALGRIWSRVTRRLKISYLLLCTFLVVIELVLLFTPWQLRGLWTDLYTLLLAYLALASALGLALNKAATTGAIRWVTPIAICLMLVLAIPWLVLVETVSPAEDDREIQWKSGTTVLARGSGWGGNDFEEIRVLHSPNRMPFLQYKVSSSWYLGYVDCSDLHILPAHEGRKAEAVCGRRPNDQLRIILP